MEILIRYTNGERVEALMLSFNGRHMMRVVTRASDDTVELRQSYGV